MAGDENVTIRVKKTTKAAMDIFAAQEYARTGKSLTNEQVIERLLSVVDPAALEQAQSAASASLMENDGKNN